MKFSEMYPAVGNRVKESAKKQEISVRGFKKDYYRLQKKSRKKPQGWTAAYSRMQKKGAPKVAPHSFLYYRRKRRTYGPPPIDFDSWMYRDLMR